MKSGIRKRLAGLLCAAMLIGAIAALPVCAEESGGADAKIFSHGTEVLSARTDLALYTMKGNDLVFTKDAVERGMNLSEVRYLTVLTLPPVTDGELLLGSSRVAAGQTVSGEHLDQLCFHPAREDLVTSAFRFAVNGAECGMTCSILMADEKNGAPTVAMAPVLSLKLKTYKGLAAYGTLSANDPEGDAISFEVVSYPQNGSLELTDVKTGSYVYRPFAEYVGTDAFSYVARDRYGNYSASAKVSLTVDRLGTSVTYADMKGSREEGAALTVTEKAIMSGSQVGENYYFYPERTVNRAEFLVMAMNAAGITGVPECEKTVFADDADIPASMKGYVAAAYRLGYITGSQKDGQLCFLPDDALTRAQAAVILDRITAPGKAAVIPTFADQSEIPVWAADAIYSLSAVGILTPTGDRITPADTVTRAQAAQMLSALMRYREE